MKRLKVIMLSSLLLAVVGALAGGGKQPPQDHRRAEIGKNTPCDIVEFDCDGQGAVCEDGTYKYFLPTQTNCLLPEEKQIMR